MATVSLCMIVKNEEDVLARCLASVAAAVDEIIVVDTGSTDATAEIARRFHAQVFFFRWIDDFAAARNFSFSKATCDFCLWLDADDVLRPADCAALIALKSTLNAQTDVVMMPYHAAFDAADRPTFSYYRERLIRRAAGLRWEGAVHEAIPPRGHVRYAEVAVCHRKVKTADPNRNLRIYERKKQEGCKFTPRDTVYFAREYYEHGAPEQAEELLRPLIEAGEGWPVNLAEACDLLARCREAQGDPAGGEQALLQALRFTPPRAEFCCDFGDRLFRRGAYEQAYAWYTLAFHCPNAAKSGGFSRSDCRGYHPALQLCCCCWQLGRKEEAARWNERAAAYKPESEAVAYNRRLFEEQ